MQAIQHPGYSEIQKLRVESGLEYSILEKIALENPRYF